MGNLILTAPAKINLSLNVLPARGKNDYFEVRFINTQAELSDRLSFTFTDTSGVCVKDSIVPQEKDLAVRAAQMMIDRLSLKGGMVLQIEKNIPLRAGLGGGSADAAAVINGLATYAGLRLSEEEKNSIACGLGMDVCYCVVGGLCTVSGTGQVIHRLPFSLPQLDLLIATPQKRKPSTSWAYDMLDEDEMGRSMDRFHTLLSCVEGGDLGGIAENLHNDFELPIARHYPVVEAIKQTMVDEGALRALLAGSGLSVFGIFTDTNAMKRAMDKLRPRGISCIMTRTIG
jgi:4-diphosphocytidyl-2-C-methyl-D-erythritol kinase